MKLRELLEEDVSRKDINDLEKFADRILKKYGVDIEFTKHFVDRMNDPRNSPEIKVSELQRFFKKIQKNKARNIINNPDIQAVLKDMSTNLNLPVVIKTKGNEIEVTNKTIMRKQNFKTPNKVIKYESFRTFSEATESVVFTFGRFNPPTTGHEKLLDKVKKIAGGDDYYIFPSHSQNPKKDPLPFAKKVAYMRDMFPKHKRNIIANNKLKTVLDIAVYFHQQGYKELNMVVGSDRVAEFKKLLTTYNGQEKRHGFYDFDTIQIFSAGERDPDAEGVTGMSASKMRAAATNNDYDTFQKGLPRGFKNGNQLFKDVRKGMNLKENSKYSDEEIERDLYVRGAIYQIGDLVENINDGTSGEIIRRGTNYVQYTDGENVHKAFLHSIKETKKITKTKQDPDIKDSPGTEPAKYYAKGVGDKKGMSVSTKKARDAHFTKGAKMDDDNPNAYKPAPGDKGKKTKPSQYTKKFKQMYGEVTERRIDPADIDTSATDDDIAAADKNIMMQLRKSVSLRGNFPVQFMDKKKVKVSSKIAQAVQSKYNSMKKPADKEKFQNRISKSYKDLLSALKEQLNINEQPKHEITVGDYTTKFFYMCGSAQTTMKKHADKEGAEELTRMQDMFYKMEKNAMDAGGASDEQKKKSQILYAKIIAKADDMGIKKDVDSYMKAHLTSMLNNKPKLGFGRTDLNEKLDKDADIGDYVKDFKKSDAPQFKGKSMKKRHKMAVAAYLSRNEALIDRVDELLTENGHTDVASMKVKVGIAYKALERMNAELSKLGDEAELPTWWTNKVATAVSRIDDMSDYIDYQVEGAYQLDEKIKGLVKKAEKSGMPYGVLKKVYDRGMAAWRTGHRPGTTPQQWAFARVNSFTTKSKGSWGGAVGMTQMIPTTFLETAYDWDGDGIDIWNSYADAFASTANYLTSLDKNPWSNDSTWGREVLPPKNTSSSFFDSIKQVNPKGCGAVKRRSIPKTLSEWSKLGFTKINGDPLPIRDDLEARLIMPDGIDGRMFIVYPNYKNILYYNCSSYYAVSVGLLSDKISN